MNFPEQRKLELEVKTSRTQDEEMELQLWTELKRLGDKTDKTLDDRRQASQISRKLHDYIFLEFIHVLAERGYAVSSMTDLESSAKTMTGKQIEAIAEIIPAMRYDRVRESLIHMIAQTKRVYDATALTNLYDSRDVGDPIRWDIGNAISQSNASGIDDWVRHILANADDSYDWHRIPEYAARRLPPGEAAQLLKPLAAKTPPNVAFALGLCGGTEEISFLEQMLERHSERGDGEIRQEIKRAISKIEKRLSK